MEEHQAIRELARILKAHGVEEETAVTISLLVDEAPKRSKLMFWLKQNPKSTEQEICRKAKEIARTQNV